MTAVEAHQDRASTDITAHAATIDAATPPDRDRVIDFLRTVSLAVVIAGHWLMAAVVFEGGKVTGTNVLTDLPVLHPATWLLQVMPMFFVAGGFANLTVWRKMQSRGEGYSGYLGRRLHRLLRPTIAFMVAVPIALAGLGVAGVGAAERQLAADVLGQPLWFLGVFVLATAIAPALAMAHGRWPTLSTVLLALAAVVIDMIRVTWSAEAGYLNMGVAWLFVQQLGFWYADGTVIRLRRTTLWLILGGAVLALAVLTGPGPYPVSMVGLPGEMSNMAPPSICLLLLAIGQTAGTLLIRRRLAAWLDRPGAWAVVVKAGSMAMSLYLWHLVVLVAALGGIVAFGVPIPEPGSAAWWLSRPVWLVLLGAALLPMAAWLSRLERGPRVSGHGGPGTGWIVAGGLIGVALVVGGLFGIVVHGLAPSTATLLCIVAVVAGWALSRRAGPVPSTPA